MTWAREEGGEAWDVPPKLGSRGGDPVRYIYCCPRAVGCETFGTQSLTLRLLHGGRTKNGLFHGGREKS